MMTDFFRHHRNKDLFYNLNDKDELKKFISACPEGTVTETDSDEAPDENIYRLNDRILIREYMYTTDKD